MSTLNININTEDLIKDLSDIKDLARDTINKAVGSLAASTNAKVHELASEQLKTTSSKYRKALNFEEISKNVWVVSLDESMLWREEGMAAHSQIDDLLRNNAKISQDGEKYKYIPMDYSGPESEQSPKTKELVKQIKSYLKTERISFKKVEFDPNGNPRLGKIHSMNIPSDKPTAKASTPALQGINIYQKMGASGKVERHITAFRTVSESQKEEGKWRHPGIRGANLFDQAFEWAVSTWETEILPEIMASFGK
jgi:hypothetical protein